LRFCGGEELCRSEYQLGLTKVFFRPGKQQFLENLLSSDQPLPSETAEQIRRFLLMKRFYRVRAAVLVHCTFTKRLRQMRALKAIKRAAGVVLVINRVFFRPLRQIRSRHMVASVLAVQACVRAHQQHTRFKLLKRGCKDISQFWSSWSRRQQLRDFCTQASSKRSHEAAAVREAHERAVVAERNRREGRLQRIVAQAEARAKRKSQMLGDNGVQYQGQDPALEVLTLGTHFTILVPAASASSSSAAGTTSFDQGGGANAGGAAAADNRSLRVYVYVDEDELDFVWVSEDRSVRQVVGVPKIAKVTLVHHQPIPSSRAGHSSASSAPVKPDPSSPAPFPPVPDATDQVVACLCVFLAGSDEPLKFFPASRDVGIRWLISLRYVLGNLKELGKLSRPQGDPLRANLLAFRLMVQNEEMYRTLATTSIRCEVLAAENNQLKCAVQEAESAATEVARQYKQFARKQGFPATPSNHTQQGILNSSRVLSPNPLSPPPHHAGEVTTSPSELEDIAARREAEREARRNRERSSRRPSKSLRSTTKNVDENENRRGAENAQATNWQSNTEKSAYPPVRVFFSDLSSVLVSFQTPGSMLKLFAAAVDAIGLPSVEKDEYTIVHVNVETGAEVDALTQRRSIDTFPAYSVDWNTHTSLPYYLAAASKKKGERASAASSSMPPAFFMLRRNYHGEVPTSKVAEKVVYFQVLHELTTSSSGEGGEEFCGIYGDRKDKVVSLLAQHRAICAYMQNSYVPLGPDGGNNLTGLMKLTPYTSELAALEAAGASLGSSSPHKKATKKAIATLRKKHKAFKKEVKKRMRNFGIRDCVMRKLLEEVLKNPIFGCRFFEVRQDERKYLPEYVCVGINGDGVFILNNSTKQILEHFKYDAVMGCGTNAAMFSLVVIDHNTQGEIRFNLHTREGSSMKLAIRANIKHMQTKRKAHRDNAMEGAKIRDNAMGGAKIRA